MANIGIVTDTDSSLPPDLASRYDIRQVPINIHFGTETFRACEDIDDAQMFSRIESEGVYPTSSAPSPGQFAEAYRETFDSGAEEIVCLCVSGKVSATYDAALQARAMFEEKAISVLDTRSLSMGQGFMALEAARAAAEGASRQHVLERARQVGARVRLYGALSTLRYLAMSGRVPSIQAGVANLLEVKPILTLEDGMLELLERVRTRTRAWKRLVDLAEEAAGGKTVERMALLHINAQAEARQLGEMLRERLRCPQGVITAELTPGLSIFGGTGMVGVAFVVER